MLVTCSIGQRRRRRQIIVIMRRAHSSRAQRGSTLIKAFLFLFRSLQSYSSASSLSSSCQIRLQFVLYFKNIPGNLHSQCQCCCLHQESPPTNSSSFPSSFSSRKQFESFEQLALLANSQREQRRDKECLQQIIIIIIIMMAVFPNVPALNVKIERESAKIEFSFEAAASSS